MEQTFQTTKDNMEKSLSRKSPKTDSEDECDTLVIRPKISQQKKKYQFSITKQASNPLKQIKLKRLSKEKPTCLPMANSCEITHGEEKKVNFPNVLLKTEFDNETEKPQQPSSEGKERSNRRSRSKDKRNSSRSPIKRKTQRYSSLTANKKDRSRTPNREKNSFNDKTKVNASRLDSEKKYDIKLGAEKHVEKENDTIIYEAERMDRLKEMETVVDFLKSNKKPRFNVLALPREGSQSKNFISYSQKIVHFTSTPPTISWAPNPKSEDQPYYMSRDFYLDHANADQIKLFRAIAESNHIKFEDAPDVINARSWYPKDGYLSNKVSKGRVRGREKRISLVDYDSADDREESRKGRTRKKSDLSSLRIEGNTVKVKSKWDSDYEESLSEPEPSLELNNKSLPEQTSKSKASSPLLTSHSEIKKDEPEQLANEYEEFLKQVGSETPDNNEKVKISRTKYSSPPIKSKNDWDNDTSSSSCKKYELVTSEVIDSETLNTNTSKQKNDSKKKLTSKTDSSSESSDSSSDSSTKGMKIKKKKKKNKQKKKKVIKKAKAQTSSSESEEVEKKSKKGKAKKPNKVAAKLLHELQFQKLAIAKKLSELDTVTDKKSKKAIVKDLKVLEEQILKSSKLETLLLPKKKNKKKKEKKKRRVSSSSNSESDAETKKKKSKKDKKKTKSKKKVASDSTSESDTKKEMKIKKNSSKKVEKSKKKKEKIEAILDEIKESCEKSKDIKRKRPAEEDMNIDIDSKRKIHENDISGWEDDDSKVKDAADSVKMFETDSNILSQGSKVTPNDKMATISSSPDIIADESMNEKPGNCDWEANSESELASINNQDKLNQSSKSDIDEKSEIRAFGAVTQKILSPVLTKPTDPILDLYSPGDDDSDVLDNETSIVGPPIIPEDSISIPFSIPPVSETSNQVLPTTAHLELSTSSSTGCVVSIDDVYDPLAIDSDGSEESLPKASSLSLSVGLDDIPLPAFSSVADILLPGETSSPKKSINKLDQKNNALDNTPENEKPIKMNRWDSVEKSSMDSLPIDISSLGTIPLLIPKLPPISLSDVSVPKEISNADKSSQPIGTSFITVKKGNAKLQSTVASVFQSNSDDEDSSSKFKSSITKLPIDMISEIDITNLPIPKVPARVIEIPIVQEPKFQEVIEKINAKCEEKGKEKKHSGQDTDHKHYSDKNRRENKEYDKGRQDKRYEKCKESLSYASDNYKRDAGRKRSVSPKKRESRRTPDRRRRSRSTERRRSRTPDRKRSRTPDRRRSRTPDRRRSRSPNRRFKRRSRSLDKRDNWRRRSPSPRRKQRSPSPKQRRRPLSPRRKRTRSKSRSYSPRGYRRSRSPVRRPITPPGRSPARRPLSPIKRRSFSPAPRSPVRRRSTSPSASRSRNNFVPAYGQPGSTEINPPLPTMPFPAPVEKVMPESIYTMSVDHRIMHEFGVKLDSPPPPPMAPTPAPAPAEPPHFYYPSPPAFQVVPIPPFSASQGGVVQVGNIMEVVPSVHALPPPPPPPPPPKQQIVQVGNMLQVVPTTRATAVVAPTPITPDPVATLDANVLQNPLIKAIQAEREKMKKEKDGRRAEREARRRLRQAKREAKLMSVSEKLKNVERNEGLVLGQDVDDEELLLEAMEPPSPPRPVKVVTAGHLPPAGKSILVTPVFNEIKDNTAKKHVSFADGLKPGESSEGEEKKEEIPKILPKEKRFKKKVKKKVKVRIIRQVIQSDEEDELPPPSPPPGDPPPILYATFPFGGQVQYPVYQTSVTTTTTKTTLHISAPLPQ